MQELEEDFEEMTQETLPPGRRLSEEEQSHPPRKKLRFRRNILQQPQQAQERGGGKKGFGTVNESLRWPEKYAEIMGSECLKEIDEMLMMGIDVTTDYSGAGQAETALSFIAEHRKRAGYGPPGSVRFVWAGDILAHCRKVLQHYRP